MSTLSNNHYNQCIECKKKNNQIEEYDKIISNLRAKVISAQDELLLAQKEIIEYQRLLNLKRINYINSVSNLNGNNSDQCHISSEQRDLVNKDRFKLFFGNIIPPITRNVLIDHIETAFGRVIEYHKDPVSPFAFINFADASGYNAALNQGSIRIKGVNVRIEVLRSRKFN
ncbi:unnamed protein product [Rhizophagus irregularis]|uniref:RRM domain-containing protein n=5 Tax=Rhizophagus irregularis TaxID=588596 RepID=A0A2I1EXP9_9GLOM|nr:hypothetical protein RirG_088240 [Rhizophagus irregularis DAOM 197198w]PKC64590.1 hypothetical protein RhiirA1_421422 [Rhizophagus irregularis]GBC48139.1 hypothetical protein GLOIN_2v1731298 [Rhizophagus irregularis DAOM 181602=DAOM 197198]PKK63871.1 hypothetical protein RhiirC2_757612 [Rhizophagus irregularis]PKY26894.1 hypothetical protein RhiirB3_415609 [Rhizophagus irregularis]